MLEKDDTRRLRQDPEAIRQILDHLDEHAGADPAASGRTSVRHKYRTHSVLVELAQQGTGWVRCEVPPRNLSSGGVAFLLGYFVYPGTICRLHLLDRQSQKHVINGVVVHCRYLEESGTLYEVGVQFAEQIEVETFNSHATRLRFLMVDDDRAMRGLVGHLLKQLEVELTGVDDGENVLELVAASHVDLVLLDLELTGTDGLQIVRALREQGFNRPIVALTALTGDGIREKCLQAGCNSYMAKPTSAAALADLVRSLKNEPLVSSLAKEPDMGPLISAFVKELPIKVQNLEECFGQQDHEALARLVRKLKGEGGAYGFQPITDAAASAEEAVLAKQADDEIRNRLRELIRVCSSATATS